MGSLSARPLRAQRSALNALRFLRSTLSALCASCARFDGADVEASGPAAEVAREREKWAHERDARRQQAP